jgi:multidrug resistance efflux pump
VNAQDSVKAKNRHGIPDTTGKDSLGLGALIDTINTNDTIQTQTRLMEQPADPESKIRNMENDISFIKASLKKSPNESRKNLLASLENSKNNLKSRIKEANDSRTSDKWEKEYSELKIKIDKLKSEVP